MLKIVLIEIDCLMVSDSLIKSPIEDEMFSCNPAQPLPKKAQEQIEYY